MSRRILAIFAHPDDETFLAGGTMAKYAASGWEVFVLCSTRGEAGRRGDYEKEALLPGEFALIRQREMEAACEILGVRAPIFMGCADQGVLRECLEDGKEDVIRLLRDLKPDVVITFGPDGVSGHIDHVAINRIATEAVLGARIRSFPAEVPEKMEQYRISSLYYVLRSDLLSTCCKPEVPVTPPPVTTNIDVSGFVDLKLQAMRCYRSQEHLIMEDPGVIRDALAGRERFHRAFPAFTGENPESRLYTAGSGSR